VFVVQLGQITLAAENPSVKCLMKIIFKIEKELYVCTDLSCE
jgi:hypothetical protein